MSSSILVAEGLTVGYRAEAPVLKGLSLGLEPGSLLAVIGPNGAGKTTLFRALCGELPLQAGEVRLLDRGGGAWVDVRALSPRRRARRLARVLQNESPAWSVPVADYVEAGLFAREGWFGRDPRGTKAVVAGALERMGVAELAERPVTELSGGEFRRVVIARALAQDAEVLLLDEPTADLDMAHQVETLAMLRELASSGKAVAFSVHDLNQAAMAADQVLLLAGGSVVAFGSPAAVLTPGIIEKVYGAKVIVGGHPAGSVPHVVLVPPWLGAGGGEP